MNHRVSILIIILISAAILVTAALSLSGQVLLPYDEPEVLNQQNGTDPAHPAPSFSLTVTPATAHARPGDPVDCEVLIVPQNGFNESVALSLEVDAGAVFRGTFDAGVMNPPYPRTYEYRLVVPAKAPAPVTVHGTLRAREEGIRKKLTWSSLSNREISSCRFWVLIQDHIRRDDPETASWGVRKVFGSLLQHLPGRQVT